MKPFLTNFEHVLQFDQKNQKLGQNFYTRESSKPICKKMKLRAVKNLYRQRCIMEIFKIIKYNFPV